MRGQRGRAYRTTVKCRLSCFALPLADKALRSEIEKDATNPLLHGIAQLSITPLVDITSVNLELVR